METVIVDGEVLMAEGAVKTLDTDAVRERAKSAVDRFESETDWELGIGGSEPPNTMDVARDLPKRGPVQLFGRLAVQSAKDKFSF